jgi:hypothetical protein
MSVVDTTRHRATSVGALARTLGVIIGGAILGQLLSGIFTSAIVPNLGAIVLYRYNPTLQPGMRGHEEEIRHGMLLLRYVADPLAGLAVGMFVGCFQRSRPAIVALSCWMPEVFFLIVGTNFLRSPLAGITQVAPGELLTIACSISAAQLVWRWRHSRAVGPAHP